MRRMTAFAARAAATAALGYAAYAAATWYRYGKRPPGEGRGGQARDALLDRFFPRYEVRERHQTRVDAPAEVVYAYAREMRLGCSPIVRAIFALRELPSRLMGTLPPRHRERGIVEEMLSLGWGVLAEEPGREIVMAAVTQPWKADVVFRPLPPEAFATFSGPGYVKIAWTLAVEPTGPSSCVFRTETRAIATDADSRSRFRRYWSLLSPGIVLIRREMLRVVAGEAGRSRPALVPAAVPEPAPVVSRP